MLKNGLIGNANIFLNSYPNTEVRMGNSSYRPGTLSDLQTGSSKMAGLPLISDFSSEDVELMSLEE